MYSDNEVYICFVFCFGTRAHISSDFGIKWTLAAISLYTGADPETLLTGGSVMEQYFQ